MSNTYGPIPFTGKVFDNTAVPKLSANFNTRRFYYPDGVTPVFQFGLASKLLDASGVNSVGIAGRNLFDSAGNAVLDWDGQGLGFGLRDYWTHPGDLCCGVVDIAATSSTIFTLLPFNGNKIQRINSTGNSTMPAPGPGMFDGQVIQVEWHCTGGAHTMTPAIGATDAFLFGSDFLVLPTGASGKTYCFAVRYNLAATRWWIFPGIGGL